MYLLMPPTPAQQPRPIVHPALPSGTLGISSTLPAHPRDPITNPNQPRHHSDTLFFWVVGKFHCGYMKYVWVRPTIDI